MMYPTDSNKKIFDDGIASSVVVTEVLANGTDGPSAKRTRLVGRSELEARLEVGFWIDP